MPYTTADILTKSHINDTHAATEYFPLAESRDGRFSWFSGSPGYVRDLGSAQTVYLQYGDRETDAATLAEMRSFARAVSQLREERRTAREEAEIAAAVAEEERVNGPDRVYVAGREDGWYEWTRNLQPTGRRVLAAGPLTAHDPVFVALVGDAIGVYSIRRP